MRHMFQTALSKAGALATPGLLSLVTLLAPTAVTAQITGVFGDSTCLGVKFSQGQPLSELRTLKELGVRWVRDSIDWSVLEPQAGHFVDELPATFKARLNFYKANNIGLIAMLAYGNQRAYPDTPENPTASISPDKFSDYAAYVAKALKKEGVEFVLEVFNEPHNYLPKRVGGKWNGMPPSPWVPHYVAMVNQTISKVHALDPNIQVFSQDDMWHLQYWFMENGLSKDVAGFTVHPYNGSALGPEIAPVAYDTDWTRPFHVVDKDRSFASAVRRLKEQGIAKLGKAPAVWITEWGWLVDGAWERGKFTEETIAAFLPRAFIIAAFAGVEKTCWFSAQDSVDGAMGLSDNRLRRRPAYHALAYMNQRLGNAKLVKQMIGERTPTKGVQAYLFQTDDSYIVAAWQIDAADGQPGAALSIDRLVKPEITDIYGNAVTPTSGSVELGISPIYITTAKQSDNTNAPPLQQLTGATK